MSAGKVWFILMNKYDFYNVYLSLVTKALQKAEATGRNGEKYGLNEAIEIWSEKAKSVRDDYKGLLFFCGNGASATMAEHMSHDWFQNAQVNTTTCSETAHITAISNDLSYEEVFSFRIGRILSEKDMLIAISSSGNSPNIVKAVQAAAEKGAFIVTLSGKEPCNKIRNMGDLNFYVGLDTYGMVESAHALLLHLALDYFLETYMGGQH